MQWGSCRRGRTMDVKRSAWAQKRKKNKFMLIYWIRMDDTFHEERVVVAVIALSPIATSVMTATVSTIVVVVTVNVGIVMSPCSADWLFDFEQSIAHAGGCGASINR